MEDCKDGTCGFSVKDAQESTPFKSDSYKVAQIATLYNLMTIIVHEDNAVARLSNLSTNRIEAFVNALRSIL